MDVALRRLLGDAVEGAEVRRAAELATAAVEGADHTGRPLGAANAALPDPGEPHLRLWQALGAIREGRGDGHISCLVASEVGPCESLVLQAATGRSDGERLRDNRGWSAAEWQAASEQLQARGWLDDGGRTTAAGAEAREGIEADTDRLAAALVAPLGDRTAALVEAMRPIAERVMAAGDIPERNNMGLPWPPA
jgi:hypothetical protein